MYYIAKFTQAAGLAIILIAFVINFPDLMSYRTLAVGICVFLFGWIIGRFLIKKQ